jgi:PAT family beta-lactamase induction signal transducer AmpG
VYSLKFLWAPVVDRMPLPVLHRAVGRRRGWMLLAQAGIALALFNLSLRDPTAGVATIAAWALFLAFCAATQDIAIDAWRIESAAVQMQGAMAAAYQIGYRIALITGSAGAFTIADRFGWHASYATMAALVGVGVVTTLLIREPQAMAPAESVEREARVIAWLERKAHWPPRLRNAGAWFIGAVVCPLVDFFGRYGGRLALALLLFIGVYRLTEFTMGSMANPFYIDHGYTLTQIATVVKVYGLAMSVVGVLIAGVVIAKLGLLRSLVVGSVMIMLSNIGFAALASGAMEEALGYLLKQLSSVGFPTLASKVTPGLLGLGLVNAFDNLALAIHGTSLIAFLSSLTSPRYTATQYALFSSLYALPGKILEGMSGHVVDAVGYPAFFLYTASLSLPGLLMLYCLTRTGAGNIPALARAPSVGVSADVRRA